MKKVGCSIFFILLTLGLKAQIETDKVLHFVGGNLYGLAGAGIAKQISDGNRWWTFAGAIGGSAIVGIGKEAIDSGQENNQWDNGDLLATILGGATVGLTIDLFTDHKKNRQKKLQVYNWGTDKKTSRQYKRLDHLLQLQELPSLTLLALPEVLVLQ